METKEIDVKKECSNIERRIFTIRGVQVIMDRDIAELYGVETRVLNQAVRRNIKRFPDDFMFALEKDEIENWKSQIVISNSVKMGMRKPPLVFTEQGVAMLSGILYSEYAIEANIKIMRAFVKARLFLQDYAQVFHRLDKVEVRQIDSEHKIDQLFDLFETKAIVPKQGIFYDGQIFDAYVFVSGLIEKSETRILLIDNYVDETVLTILDKRKQGVSATIITKAINKKLALDVSKHNAQYEPIAIKESDKYHDRFLVIDNLVYHLGASMKDLGKKCFAFSLMNDLTPDQLFCGFPGI